MGIKMIVYGKVQGVNFRWNTKKIADNLKIHGIVKNQNDGSVYIEAYSNNILTIKKFIDIIKSCPAPNGYVTNIEITKNNSNFKKYNNFQIIK